jgi:hypothetical protein
MYFNCIFDSTQGAFDLSYFIGSIHFTMYTFLCVGCGWFSGKGEAGERGGKDWMGIVEINSKRVVRHTSVAKWTWKGGI